jgi:general secretion pathway protein A
MYEAYYGLSSKPFQLNPDPAFYFGSAAHKRAVAYLEYGVMRAEGFIVITGDVGAGKTTIVQGLLNSIDPNTVVAAQLVSTRLEAEDTLRLVGAAFGVRVSNVSKAEILMALEAYFISQSVAGKRCLLVVDEAQNLKPQAVEELRMLSNFQYGNKALLQTFLIGQPEFRDILQRTDMLQLRQRVTARCHLGPMTDDETKGYILHRLWCAGSTGLPIFDDGVFARIHEFAGGIPRRINLLCDRLLLTCYLSESPSISLALFDSVVSELREEQAVPHFGASAEPMLTLRLGDGDSRQFSVNELDQESQSLTDLQAQLGRLTAGQLSTHLMRIERSVLRQERLSIEILALLQKLQESRGTP